jgi:hypothetical protein
MIQIKSEVKSRVAGWASTGSIAGEPDMGSKSRVLVVGTALDHALQEEAAL